MRDFIRRLPVAAVCAHFFLFFMLFTPLMKGADRVIYKNPVYDTETRAKDLLKRMTPEEKFGQLFICDGTWEEDSGLFSKGVFGLQPRNVFREQLKYEEYVSKLNSIQRFFIERTRLGIPVVFNEEALHGLVYRDAVSFPQAIALGATFDTALVGRCAEFIAAESEAYGIRQVFSPVINLAGDPRWGRTEECYGEDPFLVSRMGVSFIRPFEANGIAATPKHFVANYGEGGRDSYPIGWSERYLRQTHLPPFRAAIKEGGAKSVMAAYNSYDGRPCSASEFLLNDLLRKEWGFQGVVISDAGGTGGSLVLHRTADSYEDAGKQAIEAGLDAILQTDISHLDLFKGPFLRGEVDPAKLDSAVLRVLRLKIGMGLFEHPYIQGTVDLDSIRDSAHALAGKAAVASFVLLKNDTDSILPLKKDIRSILVVGESARKVNLGGYSGTGYRPVSFIQALDERLKGSCRVMHVDGCGKSVKEWETVPRSALAHRVVLPTGKYNLPEPVPVLQELPGLKARYFNSMDIHGTPDLERVDSTIDFRWTLYGPDPAVNYDFFAVTWEGTITGPDTGIIRLGIEGNDGYRMYLDGKVVIDTWNDQSVHTRWTEVDFRKRKTKIIRIEYHEPEGNSRFRLIWNAGVSDKSEERLEEAVKNADSADAVILLAEIDEGEFMDRSSLSLPGRQEEEILRLAATGKPVIVLLQAGSAVRMDRWIDSVDAVMAVWYAGEAGGEAITDVLTGVTAPSGKLPITFPVNEGQLPLTYLHEPTGRGDDYFDGTGHPLFPFGFGLSYTTFEYGNLSLDSVATSTEAVTFSYTITNTGKRSAAEVAQYYIAKEQSATSRPVKKLIGFDKINLGPGETKTLNVQLPKERLLNEDGMDPVSGTYRLMIGSSSKDIRLRCVFIVN
ncbi:MAG: hypothetical protein RL021_97 [Bacteroidota bacterium]